MAKKTVTSKKRNVKVSAIGQLHVHSSFNNIIVSLANDEGQIISWSSAGKMGFRGNITFVTTAKTDEEGYALLKAFGLPFKNAKND